MPVKMFTCEVCGEQVSKRKSYAHGEGRACKTHEEAQESHKKSEEQRELNLKKRTGRSKGDRPNSSNTPKPLMKPMCWTCGSNAIPLSEWARYQLVAMEKVNLQHKNINAMEMLRLQNEEARKMLPEDVSVVVNIIHIKEDKQLEKVLNRTRKRFRDAVKLGRGTCICSGCAKSIGIKWQDERLTEKAMENSAMLGAVYELSGMKEANAKIAEEMIAKESDQ